MKTLEERAADFIQYCERDRKFSKHTVKAYRYDLEKFTRHLQSEPRAVSRKDLKEYANTLAQEGDIEVNPARYIRCLARLDVRVPRTLTLDQLTIFFDIYTAFMTKPPKQEKCAISRFAMSCFSSYFLELACACPKSRTCVYRRWTTEMQRS